MDLPLRIELLKRPNPFRKLLWWRTRLGVIGVSGLAITVIIGYVHDHRETKRAIPLEAVEQDIIRAQQSMVDALARASRMASELAETSRKQQEDLASLHARYESLKALTTGQEQIAHAHRAILTERSWPERLIDAAGGFFLGLLSSLVASWLWEHSKRAKDESGPARDQP